MAMASQTRDILVIGGGFAGLSAASTLSRQNHSATVFDSREYRNQGSSRVHTVPTWDQKSPDEIRAIARRELESYGSVQIETAKVDTVRQIMIKPATTDAQSDTKGEEVSAFEAKAGTRTWVGRKLILATGVEDIMPETELPGYTSCWISGIFHCLYCHGWEETGATSSGILAFGDIAAVPLALHSARQALRISDRVTLYTHGNEALANDLLAALKRCGRDSRFGVDSRKISQLEKSANKAEVILRFGDGGEKTEGFLAHKPKSRLRGDLAQQLGLSVKDGANPIVPTTPPFNRTDVYGVFVAGDICGPMPTATFALASGSASGAAAPLQLQAESFNQKPLF